MDLKLPKLGEGADTGVVVAVLVNEGDTVSKDQTIIELENEKAVAAIPATAGGVVLNIHVKAGDKVSVGQKLITLSGEGVAASSSDDATRVAIAKRSVPEPEVDIEKSEEDLSQTAGVPVASPSLRRWARELGINLGKIRGSGAGGRIEIGDVRNYIARLQASAAIVRTPSSGVSQSSSKPVVEKIDFSKWGTVTKKSITPLRQVIARRMLENWNTIPHVTQFDDADFTNLNELRKKFAPAYQSKGSKLTLTPLILKAVAATLKKHPAFNSSLDEVANEIVIKDYIHIGVAVDTDAGLIVPVIRDVDKKSILELSRELEVVAQKSRERKVSGEDLKGGTFTISNQGAIGGAHFTPIINKPEVAILGLGRGAMKPVVREGKVEVRMVTPIALSYDHRVIDGGAAARFTVDLLAELQDFNEDAVKI